MKRWWIVLITMVPSLLGCALVSNLFIPSPTPTQPTLTATVTKTLVPTNTITPLPVEPTVSKSAATPLPGKISVPIAEMDKVIPWLPIDNGAKPYVYFYYFNLTKPPFNQLLVRKAFAAAVNREKVVELYMDVGTQDKKPATNLTPPETLGRDLYEEVGITYNPVQAQVFMEQAGYKDASSFPEVTFMVNLDEGVNKDANVKIAETIAGMWQESLGITVTIEALNWDAYLELLTTNPPGLFRMGWPADYNDPDAFLRRIFSTDAFYNLGKFSNVEFDRLVEQALDASDPAARQILYIQAERILCEQEVALIPIYHALYSEP